MVLHISILKRHLLKKVKAYKICYMLKCHFAEDVWVESAMVIYTVCPKICFGSFYTENHQSKKIKAYKHCYMLKSVSSGELWVVRGTMIYTVCQKKQFWSGSIACRCPSTNRSSDICVWRFCKSPCRRGSDSNPRNIQLYTGLHWRCKLFSLVLTWYWYQFLLRNAGKPCGLNWVQQLVLWL